MISNEDMRLNTGLMAMCLQHCSAKVDRLEAELADARAFQLQLAERVIAQSELLRRVAEKEGVTEK